MEELPTFEACGPSISPCKYSTFLLTEKEGDCILTTGASWCRAIDRDKKCFGGRGDGCLLACRPSIRSDLCKCYGNKRKANKNTSFFCRMNYTQRHVYEGLMNVSTHVRLNALWQALDAVCWIGSSNLDLHFTWWVHHNRFDASLQVPVDSHASLSSILDGRIGMEIATLAKDPS